MEVGEDVAALDVFADEAHLAVARLVVVEVSEVGLEDTTTQTVGGNLGTSSAVDQSLASFLLQNCKMGGKQGGKKKSMSGVRKIRG